MLPPLPSQSSKFVLSFNLMKPSTRWLNYILLNILISALVTGAILFFYDRYQRTQQEPMPLPGLGSTPGAEVNSGSLQIQITSVIGAGVVETESVVIENKGADAVLLNGWSLRTADGDAYTFPSVNFHAGAALQVHSTGGDDSPVDVYWGRLSPAWQSGETASLFDSGGTLRAIYTIP